MYRQAEAKTRVEMKVADLLADIGAIDAHLMTMPMDEVERMQTYVEERTKLLGLLKAKIDKAKQAGEADLAGATENRQLTLVARNTALMKSRMEASRQGILTSLQLAEQSLKQFEGYREGYGGEAKAKGSDAVGHVAFHVA